MVAFRRFQLLFANILDLSEIEDRNDLAAWLRDFGL